MSDYDPLSLPAPPPPPQTQSPMPVAPLPFENPNYRTYAPAYSGRPGAVTTMGVFCLIVAGISLFIGGFMGLINFSLASESKSKAMRAGQTPAPVVAPPANPPEYVVKDGLNAVDRRAVLDGINSVRLLTTAQLNQVDELMALNGAMMFPPVEGTPLDAPGIAASILGSGSLDTEGAHGDYFKTGDGRIEVFDDRAVFTPSDSSGTVVAVAPVIPPLANTAPPPSLNDDQIRSVLRAVSQKEHRPTQPQVAALVDLLRKPGEQLIVPTTDGSDPAFQVQSSSNGPADGSLQISAVAGQNTSTVFLDAGGQVTSSSTVPTNNFQFPQPKISRPAALLTGGLTLANLLLATYLVVVGVFILRQSFRARWMAWLYVILKIPVTIGAALAAVAMWSSLIQSVSGGTMGPQFVTSFEYMRNVFVTPPIIGAIFPFVLAMMLLLPSVRGYYGKKTPAF